MKKLVIVLASLAIAFSANAQIGVVAGLTSGYADLNSAYEDVVVNKSVSQYHAGLVYKLNLPFGLSVQPGIVYNMKGQSLATQIATEKVDIVTKTGYLEIPVRLAWQFELGPIAPFVFAEPYLGYAVNTESTAKFKNDLSKTVAEGAASALGVKIDTKADDPDKWVNRERVNYGVGIGAGVLVLKTVSLSVKYFWDMGSLYKTDEATGDKKPSLSASAVKENLKGQKVSGIAATISLYF